MKIEKINDNQIRCTLSKEDLEDRNIKLSELAYGTGKTRELFQDMMRQANDDFGFEVNDIPLMVEAIPVSPETIILVITKVENPEETENHLSKFFSKELKEDILSHIETDDLNLEDFEDIEIDSKVTFNGSSKPKTEPDKAEEDDSLLYSIYVFENLSEVINVAGILSDFYVGDSSLYKSPFNHKYYLSLCMESKEEKLINKICSVLTEHGTRENPTYVKELFYMEHFDEIIADKAIEKLGKIAE